MPPRPTPFHLATYLASLASKLKVAPRAVDVRPLKVYFDPATSVNTLYDCCGKQGAAGHTFVIISSRRGNKNDALVLIHVGCLGLSLMYSFMHIQGVHAMPCHGGPHTHSLTGSCGCVVATPCCVAEARMEPERSGQQASTRMRMLEPPSQPQGASFRIPSTHTAKGRPLPCKEAQRQAATAWHQARPAWRCVG